jgi:hypothetical protein
LKYATAYRFGQVFGWHCVGEDFKSEAELESGFRGGMLSADQDDYQVPIEY